MRGTRNADAAFSDTTAIATEAKLLMPMATIYAACSLAVVCFFVLQAVRSCRLLGETPLKETPRTMFEHPPLPHLVIYYKSQSTPKAHFQTPRLSPCVSDAQDGRSWGWPFSGRLSFRGKMEKFIADIVQHANQQQSTTNV